MTPIRDDHPLKRYFLGLIENIFATDLGLCNPRLTGYLADLLAEFVHVDRLRVIREADGKPLDQIAEMLALIVEAECNKEPIARPRTDRRGRIYRHIGDYSLFWTGVYPEGLRARRTRQNKDRLLDYVQQGKRSYALASELTREDSTPPPELLRQLSEHFESCVHGLGLVRCGWQEDCSRTARRIRKILY